MKDRVLTCVYCGHEYPAGTPASGSDVAALTDHIKVCDKHPMRAAEAKISRLRSAMVGLIGVDGQQGLSEMETVIRSQPVCDQDKAVALNAIHALLDTLPKEAPDA